MSRTIISKTNKNTGETDFEAVDYDVAVKLNGTTIKDSENNSIEIKNTNKVINEDTENIEFPWIDLARQIAASLSDALRAHGDEIRDIKASKTDTGVNIRVEYKSDEEGNSYEDIFKFRFEGDTVYLVNGNEQIEICKIGKQSGSAVISKDLAKENLLRFIVNSSVDIKPEVSESRECSDKELLLGFKKAVQAFKDNETEENRAKVFQASEKFEGNSLKEKILKAVELCNSNQCQCLQDSSDSICTVSLGTSLLIRLLEYAREEIKDDVEIHQVVENLERICAEKGIASVEDLDKIVCKESLGLIPVNLEKID